jgi:hypothetical protein
MENLLHNFLIDVPQAAAIWMTLLMVTIVALAGLLIGNARERADRGVRVREAVRRRAGLRAQAEELSRYSEEVAVAADRAAVTVRRRRAEWLASQEESETAWQAYDAADAAARRMASAAVLPAPHTPQTPAEYADRERYLHHAAMAAFWRNEMSVLDLSDVLAHRNGWDPRRHPVEQEVVLRRAVRDGLLAAHRAAVEKEQAAWQAVETAAVAARSLRHEAFAAAQQAEAVRGWRQPADVDTRTRVGVVGVLRPAFRWGTAG